MCDGNDWITLKAMHTDEDIVPHICPHVKNGHHGKIQKRMHLFVQVCQFLFIFQSPLM